MLEGHPTHLADFGLDPHPSHWLRGSFRSSFKGIYQGSFEGMQKGSFKGIYQGSFKGMQKGSFKLRDAEGFL